MSTPNIDPNSSSSGSSASISQLGSTQVGSTAPQSTSPIADTIAHSSLLFTNAALNTAPALPTPNISIVEFGRIVESAINESNSQSWANEQSKAVSFNGFYKNITFSILDLITRLFNLITQAQTITTAYQQNTLNTTNLNFAISIYNTSAYPQDVSATTTMNQATATYNQAVVNFQNGSINQAQFNAAVSNYNSAVATYNNYVTTRNASSQFTAVNQAINTFNNETATINQVIGNVNNATAGTNFPQFTTQTPSATVAPLTQIPNAPPFPGTATSLTVPQPVQIITNSINPPVSNLSAFTTQVIAPLFGAFANQYNTTTTFLKTYTAHNDFLQFFHKGAVQTMSPSYITPLPEVFIGGSGSSGGTGSGISLTSMVTTLNNPLMGGILSNSAFSAETTALSDPLSPGIRNELQFFNTQFLQQIGLSAAFQSTKLLGTSNISSLSSNSNAPEVALGIAFSNQVSSAIQSGQIEKHVQGILTAAFPTIPANNLTDLSKQLASASQLFFLEIAGTQLAIALKDPQLFGKLIATLGNTNSLNALNSNQNLSLNEVLSNNLSVGYLKQSLTNNLNQSLNVQNKASQAQTNQTLVSNSINSALNTHQILTKDQLQSAIQTELIKNGISKENAINQSNLANAFIQSEIQGSHYLDTTVNTKNLNSKNITNKLMQQNINADNAAVAVKNGLITHQALTVRQLRDRISSTLVNQGTPPGAALLASTNAVINPSLPTIYKALPFSTFQSQLASNAKALLTPEVGALQADNLSSLLTSSVTNIKQHLSEQIANLQNENTDTVISNALDDNIRAFSRPTQSGYAATQQFLDPGKTLVHSLTTGMQSARPLPSNFQHPLEV